MQAEPFIKVKTKSVVSLEKLSEEYSIAPEEIRKFHNEHCAVHEILPETLPKFVEYIYLPAHSVKKRQQSLLQTPALELLNKISKKKYGVIIRFPNRDLQIHYTITVSRLSGGIIEIQKDKTWVNNEEVDRQIEKLAEAASEALYPLQVSTQSNGALNKIINHKDISGRFKNDIYPKLRQYYVGNVADEILGKLTRSFDQLGSNCGFLRKNSFFNLYFQPVYRFYSSFKITQNFSFYFPKPDIMADYDAEFILDKEFTRSNKVAMRIEGEESESFFNRHKKRGKVDLLYKFHRDNNEIFSVTGSISCFEQQKEHLTEVQIFELN